MATEEVFDAVGFWTPALTDDTDAPEGRRVFGVPICEQVVENGVEILLGRIPGFHQVMMQTNIVDRRDGSGGIGVGGEQDASGVGVEFAGFGQEVNTIHFGHAPVGQNECDVFVAFLN